MKESTHNTITYHVNLLYFLRKSDFFKYLKISMTQPGSYGFHIGDAVLQVENFSFACKMCSRFFYYLKIGNMISQIFVAALQQLQQR